MLLLFSGASSYLTLNQRTDFQGVYLATLSSNSSGIIVQQRTAPFGGIGNLNLKPPTGGTAAIASHTISIAAEGVASAVATCTFALSGVTLDDTIQSIEVTWSAAGANQWHPPVIASWSPSSSSVTAYIHGLASGQNYDVGITVRGRNGAPLNASPLLLGTSPSITGASIANALAANSVSWKNLLGDTSGDISTALVDGTNKRFLHSGMSLPVQTTLGGTANAFGNFGLPGVIDRTHFDDLGQPGGTNLIYNPTGSNGYTGWSRIQFASGTLSWVTDNLGGGRFLCSGGSLTAGQFDGWDQTINVQQNYQMSIAAVLDAGSGMPANCTIRVDITTTTGTVLATLSTATDVRVTHAATFNTGTNLSLLVRFYCTNNGGSTATIPAFAFYKTQLEYGTQPSPYVDHLATNTTSKVFDGLANMLSSATFKANIPNIPSWTTDLVLHWTSSGSSPNITMTFWYDNGTAGQNCFIYNPDGSTTGLGHTTSGSPSYTLTSVTTGAQIYILMYYSGGAMTTTISKTAPTQAAVNQAYADGGYIAINATTQASAVTGGGTGVKAGGGGGGGRAYL